MSFHITHRLGHDTINPSVSVFSKLLDELEDDPGDQEHVSVSVTHESEWCLGFYGNGYVIFENLEADAPVGHLEDVSRPDCLRLMEALARGDIKTVRAEAWLEGY